MRSKVILVDINPEMISAWQKEFAAFPEVQIKQDSILKQRVDAWVSPTNAKGSMDGGIDLVIKDFLGEQIQSKVYAEIQEKHEGTLAIGEAISIPTNLFKPKILISTPTMNGSAENISDTENVAFACAAAFQAVLHWNRKLPGSIRSVAIPGLGASTGQVPVVQCAKLMAMAYQLFRKKRFRNFQEMRALLSQYLGKDARQLPTPPLAKQVEQILAA